MKADQAFKHRRNADSNGKFYNLQETINPSLARAAAIADLIEVANELTRDTVSFETQTLFLAAQAIRLEIMDAQALIEAYFEETEANTETMSPETPRSVPPRFAWWKRWNGDKLLQWLTQTAEEAMGLDYELSQLRAANLKTGAVK